MSATHRCRCSASPFYQRSLSAELRHANETVAIAPASRTRAGVEAEAEVLEGDPAERIVELARLRDVDLIVVGSRGLGTLAGLLLGSVSRDVMHHADRPVLVAARAARPPPRRLKHARGRSTLPHGGGDAE